MTRRARWFLNFYRLAATFVRSKKFTSTSLAFFTSHLLRLTSSDSGFSPPQCSDAHASPHTLSQNGHKPTMAELAAAAASSQHSTAKRRALLVILQLFAFLVVFGARERYISITSTATTSRAIGIKPATTRPEVAQDFYDTERNEPPPSVLRNRSSTEIADDDKFGPQNAPVSYGTMLERHPNFRVSPFEKQYPNYPRDRPGRASTTERLRAPSPRANTCALPTSARRVDPRWVAASGSICTASKTDSSCPACCRSTPPT